MQRTPMQLTPMQLTPMQCTPMQRTPMQRTPMQLTPIRKPTPIRKLTPIRKPTPAWLWTPGDGLQLLCIVCQMQSEPQISRGFPTANPWLHNWNAPLRCIGSTQLVNDTNSSEQVVLAVVTQRFRNLLKRSALFRAPFSESMIILSFLNRWYQHAPSLIK